MPVAGRKELPRRRRSGFRRGRRSVGLRSFDTHTDADARNKRLCDRSTPTHAQTPRIEAGWICVPGISDRMAVRPEVAIELSMWVNARLAGDSITNNTIRNASSARVSVPSLVVPAQPSDTPAGYPWKWRTPLRSTSPYWKSTSPLFLFCFVFFSSLAGP
jgi:hypothetical protein